MKDDSPLPPGGQAATPNADTGLRCARCGYNLTGLDAGRCPECGDSIDWQALTGPPPRPLIAMERAAGAWKLAGLAVTWLTVLFAPWRFAAQCRSISLAHGLAFAGVCFACTPLAMFSGADVDFLIAWNVTATIYLVFQTAVLTLADPVGWKQPLRTAGFWLAVGGYTSAIVPTEIFYGPPIMFLSELVKMWLGRGGELFMSERPWLAGVQMAVWLVGLACCFAARLRRRGADLFAATAAAVLISGCILLLYAATIEFVGYPILRAIGDSF